MTAQKSAGQNTAISATPAKPSINVTPLIDVLLVMLIIFMVVSPLRPTRFLTKVPSQPDHDARVEANIHTLVVTIKPDRTLMLNSLRDMGSVNDTSKLSTALIDLFQQRLRNHVYRDDARDRVDLPDSVRIEKTVFIKAPRAIPYADVMGVLDVIKGAGAGPIGLQIDDLNWQIQRSNIAEEECRRLLRHKGAGHRTGLVIAIRDHG